MKALLDMQKKMQELKRQLENTVFDVSSSDGSVILKMNGAQEVSQVSISRELSEIDKASLEKSLKDAYNRAVKRSQEIAAQKMKETSGLNLPGLF